MSNLDFLKKFQYIPILLYFLPITIIIGNSAINILNFILIISFFFLILKKKELFKKYNNYFKFFFFISLIFFINILFSIDRLNSLISYIGFLGHFFLMLIIIYCLDFNNYFARNFFKIIFFIIILTGADTLFQYFNGVDILGFKVDEGHGRRLSGPFGDEYVVGSYLCKFFFLALLFFKENQYKYTKLFLIFLFLLIIVLSNERAASIMFFLATILYFIFNNEFSLKEKILNFVIFIVVLFSFFSFDNNLKKHFIDRTFEQLGITKTNKISHNTFLDSQWGAHYLTSIEIFKNYKFSGSGLKTFRIECSKTKYSNIKTAEVNARCNTHPHNIYLEVLSETGLLGFMIFLSMILFLLKKIINNFFQNFKFSQFELMVGLNFFILFNPMQTTGAFFSTWNGVFYWIVIPFILRINKINSILSHK